MIAAGAGWSQGAGRKPAPESFAPGGGDAVGVDGQAHALL